MNAKQRQSILTIFPYLLENSSAKDMKVIKLALNYITTANLARNQNICALTAVKILHEENFINL